MIARLELLRRKRAVDQRTRFRDAAYRAGAHQLHRHVSERRGLYRTSGHTAPRRIRRELVQHAVTRSDPTTRMSVYVSPVSCCSDSTTYRYFSSRIMHGHPQVCYCYSFIRSPLQPSVLARVGERNRGRTREGVRPIRLLSY